MEHITDLHQKTEADLKFLLERQEKLLQNKNFIKKLPDNGEKIKNLVLKIKEVLKTKELLDKSASLFSRLAITSEDENEILQELANQRKPAKTVIDERLTNVEKVNSYKKVISREGKELPKKKFQPNKSLKSSNIPANENEDNSNNLVKKDVVKITSENFLAQKSFGNVENFDMDTSPQNIATKFNLQNDAKLTKHKRLLDQPNSNKPTNLAHRYDESLENSTYGPTQKYGAAKLIPLKESMERMRHFEKTHQKLVLQQAARHLVHPSTKIVDDEFFAGGETFINYREAGDDSQDDNSSEDELDYPD